MERYIVSARKYRPQTFESVVGQRHITNTLEKAIKNNHLAQALLFCGPRGVGKTTCARILAKNINEADQVGERDFSLNIFELDAASNNSVDDIRNLIDQVRFAPQVGRFKVYIIDEVHMLSQAAFNAFLKTLEEPPAHAIFILATTEKHKILPTILSRCQIFDFKRITVDDIAEHLAFVAKEENVNADPEALHIIAQKADGALRDALSIFDRLVSFNGNSLTYESVITNLDILDYDYFFKATNYILQQDLQKLLLLFNEIMEKGFESNHFANGLAGHFRDLLVSQDPQTVALLEVGPSVKNRYLEQAKQCDIAFLIYALRILNECDINFKTSSNQRLLVEITLMQLVNLLEKKKPEPQPVINKEAPRLSIPVDEKPSGLAQKVTIQHPPKAIPTVAEEPTPPPLAAPEIAKVEAEKPLTKPVEQVVEIPVELPSQPKQEAEKPKPTGDWRSKLKGGSSGISLKTGATLLTEDLAATDANEDEEPSGPTDVFSEKSFDDAWKEFLETVQHRKSIIGVLSTQKPKLKNLTEIHLELENKTQESYLQSVQTEMMSYLRQRLNNYKLKVVVHFNETQKERKPYTAEERYLAMVKANPHLEALRKALDMDIE